MEELEDFINNINSVLESLYIEIKKGATEDDGRPVYALVSARRRPLAASVRNCGGWRRPRPSIPAMGDTDPAQRGRPARPGPPAPLAVSCAVIRAGAVTPMLTSLPHLSPCPRQVVFVDSSTQEVPSNVRSSRIKERKVVFHLE